MSESDPTNPTPEEPVITRLRGGVVQHRHSDRTITHHPPSRQHRHGHIETRLDAVPGGILISEPPAAESERFEQRIKDRRR